MATRKLAHFQAVVFGDPALIGWCIRCSRLPSPGDGAGDRWAHPNSYEPESMYRQNETFHSPCRTVESQPFSLYIRLYLFGDAAGQVMKMH
jgi:hypothetical protein